MSIKILKRKADAMDSHNPEPTALASSDPPDGVELDTIGILEYLNSDPRPVLILDTQLRSVAFENVALQELKRKDPSDTATLAAPGFYDWLADFTRSSPNTPFVIGKATWCARTLRKRWMVVSATEDEQPTPPTRVNLSALSEGGSTREPLSLDWTKHNVSGLSAHVVAIKTFPWEETSIGSIESWSDIFRSTVISMNANSEARILLWGTERTMIYNEACAPLFGQKHPLALGGKAEDIWSEAWPALAGFIAKAESEGKATRIANFPLTMERHGYEEETFWNANFVPVIGTKGQAVGVVDEFTETTSQVIQDRRRAIVIGTSEITSHSNTLEELWNGFLEGVRRADDDVPYAAIYVPEIGRHPDTGVANKTDEPIHSFTLHGAVGIDLSSGVLPPSLDLSDDTVEGPSLAKACHESWRTKELVRMTMENASLPSNMAAAVSGRAAGSTVKSVCVVPIPDVLGDKQLAFAVVALTSRRPLDPNITGFVRSLTDVLSRYASTIFLPDEHRRARQRFEEIETSLAQRLEAKSLQAEKAEARYEKMINQVPVGIFVVDPSGQMLYHNDSYLALTGATADFVKSSVRHDLLIEEQDRDHVNEVWKQCLETKQPITLEYRLKREWRSVDHVTGEEVKDECWILTSAIPEMDEHGVLERITGWLLDISDRKHHEKLNMRRVEAEVAERRFSRLAKQAPMGMYLLQPDGTPMYLNDAYYDILGVTRAEFDAAAKRGVGWADQIVDEDKPMVTDAWINLSQKGLPLNIEYRVKKPWSTYDNATGTVITGPTWLQGTAFAERDEKGDILAIQGFVAEISLKKFSERLLAERLEKALETKIQADRFIDMTSHEMRNPLSAILQSADGILTTLGSGGGRVPHISHMTITPGDDATEAVIDAAQTIILCAQHQKRIVDDILTLSKLDSNLLVISPDKTYLPGLITRCFKMYEGELERTNIETTLEIEKGYRDLKIQNVMLDSSRVLQVIINLLTNAIKFTQHSALRKITLFLNATKERPIRCGVDADFVAPRANRPDTINAPEWGNGEEIYLQIAVQDTGKGLNEEELKLLFQRFSQASPKTYKQYGGSGLGLFISRELTELQGGQIGVQSSANVGTIFTFYVKARRVEDRNGALAQYDTFGSSSPLTTVAIRPSRRQGSIAELGSRPTIAPVAQKPPLRAHNTAPAAPLPKEAERGPKTHMHVLVVEDNEINQRVMAAQLRRIGCTVHIAGNGLEALNFLERTTAWHQPIESPLPVSVVLMDLEMPVLGGLETVKRIRALQSKGMLVRHVPVIAVTANARSEQIAVAIQHGMDSVVTKPFRIPELVPQMERLVRRLEMQEEL